MSATSTDTAVRIAAEIAEGQQRVAKIVRAFERESLRPMRRNLYIDYQCEIAKEEIRLMVFDAMREVDGILGVPEAF